MYKTSTLILITLIINSVAIDFNPTCRLPRNNEQRLEWLADLVLRSQAVLNTFNRSSWISQGTLLGSVRNGAILPWTGDTDAQMFSEDMIDICNKSSKIYQAFRYANLTVFDCQDQFVRICPTNVNKEPQPNFQEAGKYTPYAVFELYGCTKRRDGLYDVKDMPCKWNFSRLFPLKQYQLSTKIKAWGPNEPIYFIEQYYGPNWSTPIYYAGGETLLESICKGKIR